MPSRTRRLVVTLGLIGFGGFLTVGPNATCASFALETVATTVDFCFIFDCQSGVLGGTIDPCDVGFSDSPNQVGGLAFADCPDLFGVPDQFPIGPDLAGGP